MIDPSGQIYLIPSTVAPDTQDQVVSPQIKEVIKGLDHYLVENIRTARRFIGSLKIRDISKLHFEVFDKNSDESSLNEWLKLLKSGESMGIISEAGCPSVADPGSKIVRWAHKQSIKVVPLAGPSSILLALMASGMNGQHFEFHGYLPIDKSQRLKKIKSLEKESLSTGKAQIFMETPYRNMALAQTLIAHCHADTYLCFACNLTSSKESVLTMKVKQWRSQLPDLHKKPTIFLLQGTTSHI